MKLPRGSTPRQIALLGLFATMVGTALGVPVETGFRPFKSNEGTIIRARLTDFDPKDGVSMELVDGRDYEGVALERFSEADQDYIKKWAAMKKAAKEDALLLPDAKIKMFVKSSRDDDLNDKGDPDNREVEYEPGITFDNFDVALSYKAVRGTLVFIGQSVLEKREYHILYREDFTVDLPVGERVRWEGRPFTNTYDAYPANGSAFGAEYEGYLLVLRDKDGQIRIIKSSKSAWEDVHEAILKADMGRGHSRKFDESFAKTVH